jgi:hypothetical protein
MAKNPTLRMGGSVAWTGSNQVFLYQTNANAAISSSNVSDGGIHTLTLATGVAGTVSPNAVGDWDADTGW